MNDKNNIVFNPEKITTLIHVAVSDTIISNIALQMKEYDLFQKPEFHITIIGYTTGEKIQEILSQKTEKEKSDYLEKLKQLVYSFNWNVSFLSDYFFITKIYTDTKEERQSIILSVNVPDTIIFYEKLKDLLNHDFVLPYMHVTLCTSSTNPENKTKGIGLYSEEDFFSCNPQKIILK